MNKNGDIIIIGEDEDNRQTLISVFEEITEENKYDNRLVLVDDSTEAYNFLKSPDCDPFIILSDIKMHSHDGFTLRNVIFSDEELREHPVPFIFLTAGSNPDHIKEAYQMSIQGYFTKPSNRTDFKNMLAGILTYWKFSTTP